MTIKHALAAAAAAAVLLAGCSATDGTSTTSSSTSSAAGAASASAVTAADLLTGNEDATTTKDDEWSLDDAVDLDLTGPTVTITKAGVYRVSGDLHGGITVAAPDDALVVLVLDGAHITSSAGAAINVQTADDVAVYLAAGSTNTLSDASSYAADADVNAALFSEADLTISGTGSLTVTGNGADGINSEDDLVVLSGGITVQAADDGLRGKDSLTVKGGTISVTAGGDGLKADNEDEDTRGYIDVQDGSVTITAGSDGVDAASDLVVTGGRLTVSQSEEGLEAAHIVLAGGTVSTTSTDDGINATTGASGQGGGEGDDGATLTITGGTVDVDAEGDGLDSNGSAAMTGGTVTVSGPTRSGNSALDVNGTFPISGGILVAADAAGRSATPDADSKQGWVYAASSGAAGDTVTVTDAADKTVATFTPTKAFTGLIVSTSDIVSAKTYSVVVKGASVDATANQGGSVGTGGRGNGGGPGGSR